MGNDSDAVTAGDLRTAEFVDSAFSDLTYVGTELLTLKIMK